MNKIEKVIIRYSFVALFSFITSLLELAVTHTIVIWVVIPFVPAYMYLAKLIVK